MIKDCKAENHEKTIAWEYQGHKVVKSYPHAIYFEVLADGSAVVVVEPDNEFSPNNAVIFNADGTERVRILNPTKDKGAICFGDVYFEQGNITLISICGRVHYACSIDGNGNVLGIHETR